MMRIAIATAFEVPAYRRVYSEEGAYDARCGSNIVAYSETRDGIRLCFLYVGRLGPDESDENPVPVCFENYDFCAETVDAINRRGSIDPRYWWCYASEDCNALPDYVLNPHRPEYN